jgi:hypothetical protein
LILLFALLQLGFATGATHIAYTITYAEFLPNYKCVDSSVPIFGAESSPPSGRYGVMLWLSLACAGDFVITGSIVWHLRKAQKTSVSPTALGCFAEEAADRLLMQGFSKTASLLRKIMRSTVENNLITSVLALVSCDDSSCLAPARLTTGAVQLDAVLFAEVNGNWHIAVNILLPKVYTLSFLASCELRSATGAQARRRLTPSSSLSERPKQAYHEPKSRALRSARLGGACAIGRKVLEECGEWDGRKTAREGPKRRGRRSEERDGDPGELKRSL